MQLACFKKSRLRYNADADDFAENFKRAMHWVMGKSDSVNNVDRPQNIFSTLDTVVEEEPICNVSSEPSKEEKPQPKFVRSEDAGVSDSPRKTLLKRSSSAYL